MKIDLTDTTAGAINSRLADVRRAVSPASGGLVLTLVVVTEEDRAYDALRDARAAAREFAARILVLVRRPDAPRGAHPDRLDAELELDTRRAGPGESVVIRLHGRLADHADSVVLPLLLPDAPVVAWWPGTAPEDPGADPVGALADRRITDALQSEDGLGSLEARARHYRPGDTDLSWSALTAWRFCLAAALDQVRSPVTGASVRGVADHPGPRLLRSWLADRLRVAVALVPAEDADNAAGAGVADVQLSTVAGDITLTARADGRGRLEVPGMPGRQVALPHRSVPELLREELRRLDHDPVYGEALRSGEELSRV